MTLVMFVCLSLVRIFVKPNLMLLLCSKVRHTQALSLPPLKSWLLVKKAGEILTGHCTCMAGRGEACSHMAAIVFLMEYAAKAEADLVGTDQLNAWLPPSMGSALPKRTIAEMDFSSPSSRIKKMQRLEHSGKLQSPFLYCKFASTYKITKISFSFFSSSSRGVHSTVDNRCLCRADQRCCK